MSSPDTGPRTFFSLLTFPLRLPSSGCIDTPMERGSFPEMQSALRSSLSPGPALLSSGNPKQVLPDVGAWAWLAQDENFTWMDLPAPNPGGKDASLGCNRGFPHAHHPVQPQLASPPPPQPQEHPVLAPAQILQRHCLETNKVLQWAQSVPRLPPLPWLCPAVGSMSGVSTVSHQPPSLS